MKRFKSLKALSINLFLLALVSLTLPQEKVFAQGDLPVSILLEELSDYHKELEKANQLEKSEKGLELTVQAIPDAYVYYMARDLKKLSRAGYDDARAWKEIKKLHTKHRKVIGKVLINVKADTEKGVYYFMQKKPGPHSLTQRTKKTFKVVEEIPKAKYVKWQVFQHPPNRRRIIKNITFARLKKTTWSMISTTVSLKKRDPFVYSFSNIVRQTPKSSEQGVNESTRQLSCRIWQDIIVKPLKFEYFPGKWKIPSPPSELTRILDELNPKKKKK